MGDDHERRIGPYGPSAHGRRTAGSSVLTPPTGLPAVPDGARVEPPTGALPPRTAVSPCLCGHDSDVHRHWRRGSDCGQCGVGECTSYRPRAGVLRRLLQGVGLSR